MKNIPIGEHLIEKGLITAEQLQQVLDAQKDEKNKGKKLGDMLQQMGLVTENQFAEVLAERLNLQFCDVEKFEFDDALVKTIPEDVARKYCCIALEKKGRRLYVATDNPSDFYASEDLRGITGCSIVFKMGTRNAIMRTIGNIYSQGTTDAIVEEATKEKEEEKSLDDLVAEASNDRVDNAPIVKLATAIVENAYRMEATDIHIEPFKDFTRVRVRVNGDLVELMTISNTLHTALVTRFKITSGMNIAEKRVPQDGRMSQVVDGTVIDLRVSNLPMVYGEKVVLRILAGDSMVRKITDLGMTDYNYGRFNQMLKVPQGVILVTGPTGSGKSTTLYAALGEMAKPNLNVITVEDPVEKKIKDINQCQINDKAGMTFAAALRSILRQDPDIIMVGEMRDEETATIAIRAAITGHMVLSTIHTNDAASTVTRLVDMGVLPYMVATSLIGICAQRLAKKLCNECKTETVTTEEDMKLMGISEPMTIYKAVGCPACNGTGYRGRTAIHEILLSTPEMQALITRGAKADEIQDLAREQGCRLLRDNVSELIQRGITSMDELVRVTYAV